MSDVPWCRATSHEQHLVIVYWGMHICWIFNILLGMVGFYKVYQQKQNRTIFHLLYIIVSVLFICAPPGFAFAIQSGWECWYEFLGYEAIVMLGLNGYNYGLAVLYLFFLIRLKFVFQSTTFRLHKYWYYLLLIGLFIQLITPIFYTYYFLSGWDDYNRGWAFRYLNAFYYTNIICSLIVFILFLKKIFRYGRIRAGHGDGDVAKQMFDQDLLLFAIRVITCATLAFTSTNTVGIITFLRGYVPALHKHLELRAINTLLCGVDTTVNLICLYLQFTFGKNLYHKYCCCIDKCCQSMIIGIFSGNRSNEQVKETALTVV